MDGAASDSLFTFETESLKVRPLMLSDKEEALEVDDPSEGSFVDIIQCEVGEFEEQLAFQESHLTSPPEIFLNSGTSYLGMRMN